MSRLPTRGRVHGAGAGLAGAYLLLVAVLEVLQRGFGWPRPETLASSPAGLAAGDVGSLITSGLVVAGSPVLQLAGTALTAMLVVQLLGASVFWAAVLAAHIGSAVIAYAGVGVLWLVARADVDAVVDAPDYGISCVWAGAAGALAAAGLGRCARPERLAALVAIGAFVGVVAPSTGLGGVEHALAFVLGAVAVFVARRGAAGTAGSAVA